MSVFVLAPNRQPLTPCSFARARLLLGAGEAAVFRRYPFTIILRRAPSDGVIQPLRLKLDPGSKTTGIALVNDKGLVVFGAELQHRGREIKNSLESRSALRRGRRNRKTRYRKPRFLNRTKTEGWLAPSLEHRVLTTATWVNRLRRLAPIESLSQELARFDMQKIENPEISGVKYQQGTLEGYEVREYLLEKWGRMCSYCDAKDVPLQIEHIHPRSKGGSDRVSNLCLACEKCNLKKNTNSIEKFLTKDATRLKKILVQAKSPLKDAAAVNSTRWALFRTLKATGLPVEVGTGGETKFNRTKQELPKAHWIDAACVGESGNSCINISDVKPLLIRATGHGSRQMCQTDKYGFPKAYRTGVKKHFSFETGDIVRSVVPKGKNKGTHFGRIVVRAKPYFKIGEVDGIPARFIQMIQRRDGYVYSE
jgi:5-methylcytosine-specific restriction endonuclease McrA